MGLDNYRDLSTSGNDVSAGFQFQFECTNCSRKWKSPFKPYRLGQITGLITRFTFLYSGVAKTGRASGNIADIGSRGAKGKALAEAMQVAETKFVTCPGCLKGVCNQCFDNAADRCLPCVENSVQKSQLAERQAVEEQRGRSASACPNCSTPNAGGRFCAECGFDMASTHKACPSCSAMLPRAARFCTDCGHGF